MAVASDYVFEYLWQAVMIPLGLYRNGAMATHRRQELAQELADMPDVSIPPVVVVVVVDSAILTIARGASEVTVEGGT